MFFKTFCRLESWQLSTADKTCWNCDSCDRPLHRTMTAKLFLLCRQRLRCHDQLDTICIVKQIVLDSFNRRCEAWRYPNLLRGIPPKTSVTPYSRSVMQVELMFRKNACLQQMIVPAWLCAPLLFFTLQEVYVRVLCRLSPLQQHAPPILIPDSPVSVITISSDSEEDEQPMVTAPSV